jgi:oxidase EvaA
MTNIPRPPRSLFHGAYVRRDSESSCASWTLTDGAFEHRTGRFFRVIGVRSEAEEHIMLDQPEIGVLAFLVTQDDRGEAKFLTQWKAEPGNIGLIQAAPTVQATRSNIDRAHGGRATVLLDEVLSPQFRVADAYGSEQGDRFLAKMNRNVMCLIPFDDAHALTPELPEYFWASQDQIAAMLRSDYRINTDARSVIVSSPWNLLLPASGPLFHSLIEQTGIPEESFLRSIDDRDVSRILTASNALERLHRETPLAEQVPLDSLQRFATLEDGIIADDGRPVMSWFDVTLPSREIRRWCQPLLEQKSGGYCTLVMANADGRILLGLRPTIEPGWTHGEFGPTFQCAAAPSQRGALPAGVRIVAAVNQSDEGGRFYRSCVRYELAYFAHETERLGEGLVWLTLGEVEDITRRGQLTTNELRSCLSLLLGFAS